MLALSFTIMGPPVPCDRARVVSVSDARGTHTRGVTPAKTRAYENHVRTLAMAAVSQARGWPVAADAYAVTIRIYRAQRRGDWDNFAKAITDAMNKVVYPDDRLIRRALVEMFEDPARPRAEVTVEVMP